MPPQRTQCYVPHLLFSPLTFSTFLSCIRASIYYKSRAYSLNKVVPPVHLTLFCQTSLSLSLPPLPLRTADCPSAVSWSLKQHIYLCISDITGEQRWGAERKRERVREEERRGERKRGREEERKRGREEERKRGREEERREFKNRGRKANRKNHRLCVMWLHREILLAP